MGVKISGVVYDTDTVGKAPIGDLFRLRQWTGHELGMPVSIKTINNTFERLGRESEQAEAEAKRREEAGLEPDPEAWSELDLLDDPEFMLSLIGIVYLSKRGMREAITIEEVFENQGFNDIEFVPDSDDVDVVGEVEATVVDPKSVPVESVEVTG